MIGTAAALCDPHQARTPHKRLEPSFWEHDWYILRRLRDAIESMLLAQRLLDDTPTVADLGCGDRPYEPLFRRAGCPYLAGDLAGEVDFVMTPGKPVDLPDGSVDGVVSFQVLEHVWDLEWYLGECRRILKPGGWLMLSTHGTWLYHAHPTDFRRWTRDGLEGEIRDHGFRPDRMEGIVGPLAWSTQVRLIGLRHALSGLGAMGSLALYPAILAMNARMVLEDRITPEKIREQNACVYLTLARR